MINYRNLALFFIIILYACNSKERQEYYNSGSIKRKCETKGNMINGTCEEYYLNGELKSKSNWVNDTLNGLATIFYENGKIQQKVPWVKGKIHGVLLVYHQNGKLKQKSEYKNGLLNGRTELFYMNGSIEKIQEWVYAEGYNFANTRKEYDSLGNLTFQDHYPIITPIMDSVTLGEDYKIKIELKNPVHEKMTVLIGDFDENYRLKDSLSIDTIRSNGFIAEYSFKPKKEGTNILRGCIIDYKERKNAGRGKNTWLQNYYFEYQFYVFSKKENLLN